MNIFLTVHALPFFGDLTTVLCSTSQAMEGTVSPIFIGLVNKN